MIQLSSQYSDLFYWIFLNKLLSSSQILGVNTKNPETMTLLEQFLCYKYPTNFFSKKSQSLHRCQILPFLIGNSTQVSSYFFEVACLFHITALDFFFGPKNIFSNIYNFILISMLGCLSDSIFLLTKPNISNILCYSPCRVLRIFIYWLWVYFILGIE